MDEMVEFLTINLPAIQKPMILVSTTFFAGCSKCGSEASVFHCQLMDQSSFKLTKDYSLVNNHKFPFPIYIHVSEDTPIPKKMWLGTQKTLNTLELVIRKIEK